MATRTKTKTKTTTPTLTMEPVAVNTATAAQMMGVSADGMYKLANTPGFPVVRIGARLVFPVDGLKKWAADHIGEAVDI